MSKSKKDELENQNLEEQTTETEESVYISKEADHTIEKAPKKRWYVVHTYSGYENKVKVNLEKRIEYMNMGEKIFRIEVPQKTITQVRAGKKTKKEEKIFPGYVLVEMIMDDDSWYVVRHTAGVTKFVGTAKKPIPAKDSEIKKIIHRSTTQTQKIEMDIRSVVDDIKQKINELGMNSYSFYIYVLPMDEAETDKKAIMQDLLIGGD